MSLEASIKTIFGEYTTRELLKCERDIYDDVNEDSSSEEDIGKHKKLKYTQLELSIKNEMDKVNYVSFKNEDN